MLRHRVAFSLDEVQDIKSSLPIGRTQIIERNFLHNEINSMREIWDTRFGHAVSKVERAKKHISDAEQRIMAAANAYQGSFHVDVNTGQHSIHYFPSDRAARRELALITGDAVHNLRSALDIAWMAVLERDFPHAFDSNYNKFPFKSNRQELETALSSSRKIDPSTALFKLMVDHIQPYVGGDFDIVSLHHLDISDKHRLLIPVSNIVSIDGIKLKSESGEVEVMDFAITHAHLGDSVEIPFGSKVLDYGKVSLSVAFGKDSFFDNAELVPTLSQIRGKVETIVQRFHRMRR
jgi:hypothetical protein